MKLHLFLPVTIIMTMTVVVLFPLLNSNVNAIIANNTYFSIQVPNGWVYRENFPIENNIVLTPNEFADILLSDNVSAAFDVQHNTTMAEFAPDLSFPIKNAPPEIYAKHKSKLAAPFAQRYENATIGGKKAIKVYTNGTELANGTKLADIIPKLNVTFSFNTISYYVMHHDQPYYLNYMASGKDGKDFQKYLPQFEQTVKTFKFVN